MRDNLKIAGMTASAGRLLLALLFVGSSIVPQPAFAACKWSNVPNGNFDAASFLSGAAAISSTDAWAVGSGYHPLHGNSNQALTEHWDGRRWKVVPSANSNMVESLAGVAAISTNDVWAVGSQYFGGPFESLIEQWNGARWTIVPSPNPSSGVFLSGVAAVSASDVWAVGSSGNDTLIEHWDGANWTAIPSPNARGGSSLLSSVSAVSANDVWAVGENLTNAGQLTLTEHWDGARWAVVSTPTSVSIRRFPQNILQSVAARSASDVWAVGTYSPLYAAPFQTLIEHWDGISWKIVPSPNKNASGLLSVAANSANDAWVAGTHLETRGFDILTEHWDGVRWTIVPTPDEDARSPALSGLAAIGSNDILSVGSTGGFRNADNLTLQFHC